MLRGPIAHQLADLTYPYGRIRKAGDSLIHPYPGHIIQEITFCMLFEKTAEVRRIHGHILGHAVQADILVIIFIYVFLIRPIMLSY